MKYPSPAICTLICFTLLLFVYSVVREINKSIDAQVQAELQRFLTRPPTVATQSPTTRSPATTKSPTPCRANVTVDPFEAVTTAWNCNCSAVLCESANSCDPPYVPAPGIQVLPLGCWCAGVVTCNVRWD